MQVSFFIYACACFLHIFQVVLNVFSVMHSVLLCHYVLLAAQGFFPRFQKFLHTDAEFAAGTLFQKRTSAFLVVKIIFLVPATEFFQFFPTDCGIKSCFSNGKLKVSGLFHRFLQGLCITSFVTLKKNLTAGM